MKAEEQAARLAVAEHLVHCLGCHDCGDTDCECANGRRLRVEAMSACGDPDVVDRLYALGECAPVAHCGPRAAAAMVYATPAHA